MMKIAFPILIAEVPTMRPAHQPFRLFSFQKLLQKFGAGWMFFAWDKLDSESSWIAQIQQNAVNV